MTNLKWIFGIIFAFLIVFFLTPTIWLMYISDPLPPTVRMHFNSVGHVGYKISNALSSVKVATIDYSNARRRYEDGAKRFDDLIDKAIEGLNVNRVDADFLNAELAELEKVAKSIYRDVQVVTEQSRRINWGSAPKELDEYAMVFTGFVKSTMTEWEKVLARREAVKEMTTQQLNGIRWRLGPVA